MFDLYRAVNSKIDNFFTRASDSSNDDQLLGVPLYEPNRLVITSVTIIINNNYNHLKLCTETLLSLPIIILYIIQTI